MAFPALMDQAWQVLSDGGVAAAMLLAVTICAITGAALRAAPAPGEPDVHDRQLDVILAVPFIGGSVWLATGWPEQFTSGQPLSGHQIIAATALLTGIYLLVAGTRLTARLRYVLILPLLALPQVTGHRVLLLLVAVTIAATVLLVIVRLRRSTRLATSAPGEDPERSTGIALPERASGGHQVPAIDAGHHAEGTKSRTPTTPSRANRGRGATQIHATREPIIETGTTR
ncbi:hypothetical protein [Kocuria sabuli]|uniref:hypothetical protein n=1 Tax=Kocuria sabuli TaxID=3071448 RepID=UPI0034D6EC69